MAGRIVPDRQTFFDQPLELSEAVHDRVGLVRMRGCAREDLIDPVVLPAGAVEEDRRDLRALGRDYIRRAVADVPSVRPGVCTEIGEGPEDRVGVGFAAAGIAPADGGIE